MESGFNSTMVRLKARGLSDMSETELFQFHYGTIKSVQPRTSYYGNMMFQFHYGTIKSCAKQDNKKPHESVSIPLWYD